ncbi:zinc finger BED domain-containing protein DAYSLEEPER-like [Coffea arabica]|uniref:Zinc finger BED domain-containing protein DAYSLEEPER-like n=1 Tax=Coffea arabica TaxID=13443 RepID=A0ABM4V4S5_COFAR
MKSGKRNTSQLDLYLNENRFPAKEDLDVLQFWKENRNRYPVISLMAQDILSIPITTVASESAFSVGGRIINKYRSTILPENVEALICTKDWLYGEKFSQENAEEEAALITDFAPLVTKLLGSNREVYEEEI